MADENLLAGGILQFFQDIHRGTETPDTSSAGIRNDKNLKTVRKHSVRPAPLDLFAIAFRLRRVRRRYHNYIKHGT
jgi:hypothetical protein